MTRAFLPHRRHAETFSFHFRDLKYTATIGAYANGQIGEIFLNCTKQSTDSDFAARDAAILISFALQSGADLGSLAKAMTRDADGRPQGLAGACLDAVIAELME